METERSRGSPFWMQVYVWMIAACGLLLFGYALMQFPADRAGILLFAILAGISELTSVELFSTSRNSRVSVSSIVVIAAIMLFGPLAGALVHGISGLLTLIPNTFLTHMPEAGRASWVRRGLFNLGMYVLAAAAAGEVYTHLGGQYANIKNWSNLPPLLGASIVDTLLNIGLLIGVIHLQTGDRPLHIWRQNFQWSAPISILSGIIGGGVLAIAYLLGGFWGILVFFLPVLSIGYSFSLYTRNSRGYIEQLEQLNRDLENTNFELMETLAAVVDAYDVSTFGHSTQVAEVAVGLGQELGLPKPDLERIRQAALLHDIGKVGISIEIISKPGRLTEGEYDIVKRHPAIGSDIISRMRGLQDLVPLVRYHHERWDGKGYPEGLAGEAIPPYARLLALADAVATMSSDRPYRTKRALDEVVAEVQRCSGTQFDPGLVQVFVRLTRSRPAEFFSGSGSVQMQRQLLGQATILQAQLQAAARIDPTGRKA